MTIYLYIFSGTITLIERCNFERSQLGSHFCRKSNGVWRFNNCALLSHVIRSDPITWRQIIKMVFCERSNVTPSNQVSGIEARVHNYVHYQFYAEAILLTFIFWKHKFCFTLKLGLFWILWILIINHNLLINVLCNKPTPQNWVHNIIHVLIKFFIWFRGTTSCIRE